MTPENCIQFGQKINLVSHPLVDLEINIFVAEVIDPSHFWIHLNSPEHNGALESLMTEMEYASIIFVKHNTILIFISFQLILQIG